MKRWIIPLLFTAAAIAISLYYYEELPARVAIHFGASGEADNWLDRPFGAFLAPVLIPVVTAFMFFSAKMERDENKRARSEAGIGTIASIMSAVLFAVHIFTIQYNIGNLGDSVNVRLFALMIAGIVFILIGNQIPRFGMRQKQWPRLPEAVQGRFVRLQGRMMIAFGFAFLLQPLLPDTYMTPAFFVTLGLYLAATFGTIFYFRRQAG